MYCYTCIGDTRVKNLKASYRQNGLTPRTHGNTKRLPKHTLSYECQKAVVTFLLNYAAQHSLVLPGRVPGFSKTDIRLLPSSTSKRGIWKLYTSSMESVQDQAVAYATFCRLWRTLVPFLVVTKPMTDLCWQCQQNSTALARSVNSPLPEKTATVKAYMEHLELVQKERSLYKCCCDNSRKSLETHLNRLHAVTSYRTCNHTAIFISKMQRQIAALTKPSVSCKRLDFSISKLV